MCELRDDLFHEGRKDQLEILGHRMPLGLHDLHLFADAQRVVRAHLRTETVLQRRDDAPARRVVLGVRACDHEQVKRKSHAVSADLHVLLFHDVEQPDLDALGEVGQFVDAEDSAVGPRQESVVDRQLVREIATLGHLDGVDLADQIRDRDVWSRQLLAVAPVALDPFDGNAVAITRDQVETAAADRGKRMVVDLTARDGRDMRVEKADQRAHDPALCLPALTEEDDVVARDDCVGELRQDGVVVADDTFEQRLSRAKSGQQVAAHLLLDGLALMAARAKLADGLRPYRGHPSTIDRGPRRVVSDREEIGDGAKQLLNTGLRPARS